MSLKIVKLSKRYKDRWILRDVSFEANDGEIFGVFGPSGSGKTTLLSTVLGSTTSNGGSIVNSGTDVSSTKKNMGGFRSDESESGIFHRLFSKPKTESSSESRTIRIQKAVDAATNVLILDDPFCGMDDALFFAIADRIRNAARERRLTVLFASSNFDRVLEFCDRTAVLANGEIRRIGTPQEIYENPESRLVASLTGRNNLFPARRLSSSKADVPEFHTIDGGHRLFAQRIGRGALGALNQNVTLAIRPEYISLAFGASFPEDNLLRATVEKIQFLGPTTLVGLDADGLKLSTLVPRVVGLKVGDECMVGLPPDRIQIFKD